LRALGHVAKWLVYFARPGSVSMRATSPSIVMLPPELGCGFSGMAFPLVCIVTQITAALHERQVPLRGSVMAHLGDASSPPTRARGRA
jgi:hypothetical protein